MDHEVNICPVCSKPIGSDNWAKIKRIFSKMLEQVDMYGEDSLTEHQQVIYHNRVHVECVDGLD
jgi:hypothetical protein